MLTPLWRHYTREAGVSVRGAPYHLHGPHGRADGAYGVAVADGARATGGITQGAHRSRPLTPFAGTPLHLAAAAGNAAQVRHLLATGSDPNAQDTVIGTTPLHLAAGYSGSVDVVRLLLAAGADPNARERSMGGTPLHVAAHSGHLDVARLLVEADADLAACTSPDGATPAQLAASRGHHHVVEYLIALAPKDEAPSDADDEA